MAIVENRVNRKLKTFYAKMINPFSYNTGCTIRFWGKNNESLRTEIQLEEHEVIQLAHKMLWTIKDPGSKILEVDHLHVTHSDLVHLGVTSNDDTFPIPVKQLGNVLLIEVKDTVECKDYVVQYESFKEIYAKAIAHKCSKILIYPNGPQHQELKTYLE